MTDDTSKSMAQRLLARLRGGRARDARIEMPNAIIDESGTREDALDRLMENTALLHQIMTERNAAIDAALLQISARLKALEESAAAAEHSGRELAIAVQAASALLSEGVTLQRTHDKRARMVEITLDGMVPALNLSAIIEERTRTLQYQSSLANFALDHQIDLMSKWYRETVARNGSVASNATIAAAGTIAIETNQPIAYASNDHIAPDSTVEGVARPTFFVRHCIDILGPHMIAVDIGTGAAGLVYEFLMNDVVALGIDGSDYCRRNKIGYWPVVPDALHTCDVTYPFTARRITDGVPVQFDLITMWEVLEHIGEASLPGILANIANHLTPTGFCLGSISRLQYNAVDGTPYHVTRQPKSWWRERFAAHGLDITEVHPFNERLFCRGNGPRFQDMHNYFTDQDAGFHFVAKIRG